LGVEEPKDGKEKEKVEGIRVRYQYIKNLG
jgi:hypothetical protein